MKRITTLLAPAALALLLAACGGGYVEPPVAAANRLAEVPASASQSIAAMASYMGTLAALPADTREPLAVDSFDPPKPDDREPEPVGG